MNTVAVRFRTRTSIARIVRRGPAPRSGPTADGAQARKSQRPQQLRQPNRHHQHTHSRTRTAVGWAALSEDGVVYAHTPSKSTAHEIRSPSPEDYYYSGHTERLLHVWNPRQLATKPPRARKSIYAAATNDENHGRALNFRARTSRRRGTASPRPPHWSKTVHADLLNRQGLEGARTHLFRTSSTNAPTTKKVTSH